MRAARAKCASPRRVGLEPASDLAGLRLFRGMMRCWHPEGFPLHPGMRFD
ncbi:MAG: hypothetical protein OXN84_13570 [Albidovulum sp.]|nr:hypothetical protein [Albidovulum sp.]